MYFPVFFKPVPVPYLNNVPEVNSNNQWTVSWTDINETGASYELQEYSDASFASPTTIDAGSSLTHLISHAASVNNYYCYRVRAKVNGVYSGWSNTDCTYGNYYDSMGNSSSGWFIRRQDTDDTNNSSYYQNGTYVIKIGGRWDYAIGSSMVPAPASSYRLETSVKLIDGVDNLQTYGIVFGGDWNGQPCPNSDYSSCFNHYYRLQVIWYGSTNKMRIDLKRIDYHDENNVGRGHVKLIDFKDVHVGNPSGWNKWTIDVSSNGTIKVYVNGPLVPATGITHVDIFEINQFHMSAAY
ncbi:MAG: hypothetical protein P8183_24090, partial [Anaerolineae bacterium]